MQKVIICFLLTVLISTVAGAQNINKILGDNYFDHLAYSKAIKHYEKALKKDSSNLDILRHLTQSYRYSGNFIKAEELYKILLAQHDTASMTDYTSLLIYNNKYNEADSLIARFNLSLSTYNRSLIDSLLNKKAEYDISLAEINTKYSDFRPCFYKNRLIFTSARDTSKNEYEWNGQPYLSLFYASMCDNGTLKNVKPFTEIDTRYHISSFQYVRNYRCAYFTMNNTSNANISNDGSTEINLGIYVSQQIKGEWQKPEPLENITSNAYSSAHPFFSQTEDRLYFSSNRPGGFGGSDIYYVEVYPGGTTEPVNCGEAVNTPGDEEYPFVSQDGYLYFSSNGHPGLGGLDVFKAKIHEDEFADIQNVGAPINSCRDDFSLIFKEDQSIGYLASNRSGGAGDDDIYLIKKIPLAPKEKKVVENITNQTNTSISEKTDSLQLPVIPDSQTEAPLLASITQTDIATAETISYVTPATIIQPEKSLAEELLINQDLDLASVSTILEEIYSKSDPAERNLLKDKVFRLYINFDFDSWEIDAEGEKELDRLVEILMKYRRMNIELSSHTDCRGKNSYNRALSQARADAALKYVLKKGVSIRRIEAVGYGEEKLVNKCSDGVDCPEEMHEQNRRVEVLIKFY